MRADLRPFAALAAAAVLIGCEHSSGSSASSGSGTHWNYAAPTTTSRPAPATTTTRPASATSAGTSGTAAPAASPTAASQSGAAPQTSATSTGPSSIPDAMSFNALSWVYGGKPYAGGARQNGVQITGLRVSKNGLSFRYVRDLSAWGYSSTALGGVACLFVRNERGRWVGGKFDWISSSRQSRDFANVYGGYDGWTLAGVPNPCPVAFVIVSTDGRRRSNVLVGTWSR